VSERTVLYRTFTFVAKKTLESLFFSGRLCSFFVVVIVYAFGIP